MDLKNEKIKIDKILERKDILENKLTENNNIFPYFKKEQKLNGSFEEIIINGDPYNIIGSSINKELNIRIFIVTKFPQFDIEEMVFTDIYFVLEDLLEKQNRPYIKKEGFSEMYIIERENKDILYTYITIDDTLYNDNYTLYKKDIDTYIIYAKKDIIERIESDFDNNDEDQSLEYFLSEYIPGNYK